jgi:hypothetical protein
LIIFGDEISGQMNEMHWRIELKKNCIETHNFRIQMTRLCSHTEWIVYVIYVRGGPIFIRPLHCDLQDLLCFPLLFIPLSFLHFYWSAGLSWWGRHGSRLVPWNSDPSDVIVDRPHSHVGHVWLTLLFTRTFRTCDYFLIPVWKCVL